MNGCGDYTHLSSIFFTNHTILPFSSSSSSSSSFFPCFQFSTTSMASLQSLASTTSPSSPHLLHPSSTKPKLSYSLHSSAFSSFHGRSLSLSTTKCHTLTRRTYRQRSWNPILMVLPKIQFIQGTDEQTIPDVRLTKSRDGTNGMAIFRFEQPSVFDSSAEVGDITGFYMIDEEGMIQSVDVNAKFINGKPAGIEAKYVMRTPREWDRFMRFMERYSNANGMQFVKK